jgi:AraC family transcriptional regulator of adaptative response / DNA-3-methyladenine glycosylase II
MEMSNRDYYSILVSRDPRFDGEFFACVSTTGIYCRPICPATKPKLENCSFVPSAAAAEDAGFRPCLRCRPESAPGSPAWAGTGSTIARAMRLLSENDLNGQSLEDLSDKLGIGSRHLRRLFVDQVGSTPKSIIQTQRLHIAMQLLKETNQSITKICQSSGFGSIRRFNDAMKNSVGVSPTEFRKRHSLAKPSKGRLPLNVRLGYRPPLNWEALSSYLAFRAIPGVEHVNGDVYMRTIDTGPAHGHVQLSHEQNASSVRARFYLNAPVALGPAVRKIRDIADLDCRPDAIETAFEKDPVVGPILSRNPGIRVPGCWDPFELTLRAIFGQQISVRGATTLLGRLAANFGTPLDEAVATSELSVLFPKPSQLAGQDLRAIGLTNTRSQTVLRVAEAFAGDPNFVHPAQSSSEAIKRLLSIKGIGDWTAQYVALRALRSPDAFPAADLGLLKAAKVSTPKELSQMAEQWRPWRGYAALLLWHSLSEGTQT